MDTVGDTVDVKLWVDRVDVKLFAEVEAVRFSCDHCECPKEEAEVSSGWQEDALNMKTKALTGESFVVFRKYADAH